ncbi:MAG: hypothetical protein JST80_10330 [Bdellovibrionales bacterium]|nr:hypothetical protein [Bdellovibrionales bacterium]
MNKFRAYAFLILASVVSSPTYAYYATPAEDCSDVDLRKDFPMAIRNQGTVSWCYAHSSADYLQFYFKIPTQISAADIAIQYNLRTWPRLIRFFSGRLFPETGFARSAMYDSLANGYCPEEYFPSETWSKRYLTGVRAGQREKVLLKDALHDLVNLKGQVQMGLYLTPSQLPYVYEFKGMTDGQFMDVVANSTDRTLPNNLRVAACQDHRIQYPSRINALGMRLKGRHTFEHINAVLDTHTPLDVDFFYGFLDNIDSYKRTLGELHSTQLMGRRFDVKTEECQYLIKNSYGPGCDEYDHRHQCEGGYVWVSESSLYGAIVSYVYVRDVLTDDSGPDLQKQEQEPATPVEMTAPSFDGRDDQSASDDLAETKLPGLI